MSIEPITKQMRALALAHRERGRHGRAKELEAFANKIEDALAPSDDAPDEPGTLRIKYQVAPVRATPPLAWGVCPHCLDASPQWHDCLRIRSPAPDMVPFRWDEPGIAAVLDAQKVEADVVCSHCRATFTMTGQTVKRGRWHG